MTVDDVMELAPVIPVLVVDKVSDALPIARALVAGGLRALEVTLRTEGALDVIREMSQVEGAVVGAGTVVTPQQLDAVLSAGAKFIVSPGLTEPLCKAVIASGTPYLPGVATAGDIMRGMTEASTTRSPSRPCTRKRSSTTAVGSVAGDMRQVPIGW